MIWLPKHSIPTVQIPKEQNSHFWKTSCAIWLPKHRIPSVQIPKVQNSHFCLRFGLRLLFLLSGEINKKFLFPWNSSLQLYKGCIQLYLYKLVYIVYFNTSMIPDADCGKKRQRKRENHYREANRQSWSIYKTDYFSVWNYVYPFS